MSLVGLLITLLVLALVGWVALYIVDLLPVPEPPKQIIKIIIAVILLIYVISMLLGGAPVLSLK